MKFAALFLLALPMFSFAFNSGEKPEKKISKGVITFEQVFATDSYGGDGHLVWSGSMTAVDVDARGHIFVTDSGANRVLEFTPEGTYVGEHGGRGQGPGEFQQLYDFRAIPGAGYFAFDNTQNSANIHLFDKDLNFTRKVSGFSGERVLQSAVVGGAGKYLAATWYAGGLGPDGTVNSGLIPLEGVDPLVLLSTAPRPQFDGSRVQDPKWFAQFIADWLKLANDGVGVMAFNQKGMLYTAKTTDYKITVYDADLNIQHTIEHDYKPKPMTDAYRNALVEPFHDQVLDIMPKPLHPMITRSVMKQAVELAEFPAVKQPIFGLLPMDNDHLLVVNDYDVISGEVSADLFDETGKFLGNAQLPPISVNIFAGFFGIHTRLTFHDGHAVAIIADEEGEYSLVRYRYNINR